MQHENSKSKLELKGKTNLIPPHLYTIKCNDTVQCNMF